MHTSRLARSRGLMVVATSLVKPSSVNSRVTTERRLWMNEFYDDTKRAVSALLHDYTPSH